ncbi:unnamed protein product [Effrenium voratum]|nr:unnamed protein product [Effrenium voratum]
MDDRPSLLLRANRQIAEVRDELARVDVQVDNIQAKNAGFLEEISLLDTEVTRLCARTALSEQQLAESFEKKSHARQEREEKKAEQEASIAQLREQLRERQQALETAEQSAKAWQSNTAVGLAATSKSDLRAAESKESSQRSLVEASRTRSSKLEEEICEERRRQQELHRSLRRAIEDRESSVENENSLKAAIRAKGADPDGPGSTEGSKLEAEEMRRTELACVEKCSKIRSSLAELDKKTAQDTSALQRSLDDAREEVQRSLAQAAEVQRAEVSSLEHKVQAERQRASIEAVSESTCHGRLERLRSTLARMHTQPKAQSSKRLSDELRRTKQEVVNAELQLQDRQGEVQRLDRQKQEAQAQGLREAQQVKAKIQEIWRSVAA